MTQAIDEIYLTNDFLQNKFQIHLKLKIQKKFALTLLLLQNRMDMKTVGHLGHVPAHRSMKVNRKSPKNAVSPEEITNWFVNVLMEMAGMEDILKLEGTNTANNSEMVKRKQKLRLTPKEVRFFSDPVCPA